MTGVNQAGRGENSAQTGTNLVATPQLPSRIWQQALSAAKIERDPVQEQALPLLDQVVNQFMRPVQRTVWRGVEVWRGLLESQPTMRGIYLHGDVGRGKSYLMQLIFEAVPIAEKRRVHFHPFMEELHQRLHQAEPPANVDLMLYIASQIAAQARLLCFDEFYITTIADGVLLGRLLESLFLCGVTVCATSNWAPDDLFQGGFNRGSVLPFIALIKKRILVCELTQGKDWRRQAAIRSGCTLLGPEQLFLRLTSRQPENTTLILRHTPVPVLAMADGVFWFGFTALCSSMLGRAEYITLCKQAKILIVSALPRLSCEDADTAMRFVVLVDLLYEQRIPLRVYSAIPLEEICYNDEIAFAWRRAVSRVHELCRTGVIPLE
ncbi:cell division protein ZapE [Candidatus Magnetaquicoccus inordinatus]|uniref:cell division protein ZapE n=1 Tax=Candidatus Magnetaquicoccus inordinatus TaxID=2496818 RepID=UPI00102ABC76|nr:cell division protein ZapE [Candidatus Magnetaquicoccus inordinatus]